MVVTIITTTITKTQAVVVYRRPPPFLIMAAPVKAKTASAQPDAAAAEASVAVPFSKSAVIVAVPGLLIASVDPFLRVFLQDPCSAAAVEKASLLAIAIARHPIVSVSHPARRHILRTAVFGALLVLDAVSQCQTNPPAVAISIRLARPRHTCPPRLAAVASDTALFSPMAALPSGAVDLGRFGVARRVAILGRRPDAGIPAVSATSAGPAPIVAALRTEMPMVEPLSQTGVLSSRPVEDDAPWPVRQFGACLLCSPTILIIR